MTAVYMSTPGGVREALLANGLADGAVAAAGALRQGRAPSVVALFLGVGLWSLFGPRKTKALPRVFVLAVVGDEVVAFRASGGGSSEDGDERPIKIGERAGTFPRSAVHVSGLDPAKGHASKNAMLTVGDETVPVTRSNMGGDPNTDELLALLSA